jgi:hypothetical protein
MIAFGVSSIDLVLAWVVFDTITKKIKAQGLTINIESPRDHNQGSKKKMITVTRGAVVGPLALQDDRLVKNDTKVFR